MSADSSAIDKESMRRRFAVGLACTEEVRATFIDPDDVARLAEVADLSFRTFSVGSSLRAAVRDLDAEKQLAEFCNGLDALVVSHGAPYVSADVLASAPRLRFIGELEGDRFGYKFDLDAADRLNISVVDTTHGSSWPTAEWALGLALIGLRNAGAFFRRLIAHEPAHPGGSESRRHGPGYDGAELSGKRVGMIGFGHLAWRLVELLRPFEVDILAYDPYVSRELANAYRVDFGPLDRIFDADVVFCLLPLTPSTEQMITTRELALLRPGAVFVNVSRGRVVVADALLERARRGDVIVCLDVFDPEPVPLESPMRDLPNVFLTPHIAGVTAESRRRFFSLMVDELLRHFSGLEPRNELTTRVARLRLDGVLKSNVT